MKIPNFSIFLPSSPKYLIGVGSKIPWSKPAVSLLFITVQKYVHVGSGQGPSLPEQLDIRQLCYPVD